MTGVKAIVAEAESDAERQVKGKRKQDANLVRDVAWRLAKAERLGKGQRRFYARHRAEIDAIVPTLKRMAAARARRSDPAK